jgi:hypothetical protein
MSAIKNVVSFVVAVSMIGFVLFAQRAYQESWSNNNVAPIVTTADTSSAGAGFIGGAETIVLK